MRENDALHAKARQPTPDVPIKTSIGDVTAREIIVELIGRHGVAEACRLIGFAGANRPTKARRRSGSVRAMTIARSRREQLIGEIAAMTDEVGLADLTVLELELFATLLTPAHQRVIALAGRMPIVAARPVLRLVE